MKLFSASAVVLVVISTCLVSAADPTPQQLAQWLKRFPKADTNGDGTLTVKEAAAFRAGQASSGQRRGAPSQFQVDPGWQKNQFPEHAVCYLEPAAIAEAYRRVAKGRSQAITSWEKPADGSLRIVGTGHSFMAPGFKTFPVIAKAAGLQQPPLLTHTGGGITGSARYKWEQENGIFQFDKKPTPRLLASIANAEWDAMMWGPYYNDRPEYYSCWIEFCLKYNPHMKFYLSDAWPQLEQLDAIPASEDEFTVAMFEKMAKEKRDSYGPLIETLNKKFDNRIFVMPTSRAMVLAVDSFLKGELDGIEGIHAVVGRHQKSLWRDRLGHLGPGLGDLEGYVFYATMYGRSPESIEKPLHTPGEFPGPELDAVFRRIAWQAVVSDPLSGVKDANRNGIDDHRESN